MKKYINIAKGNHVFIQKVEEGVEQFDFAPTADVDKIKYLIGTITSIGPKVDPEEGYKIGMLIRCAAFVSIDFGGGQFGLNADDIIGETREIEVDDE